MKGFDDHLDNYGDPNPGDDGTYDYRVWNEQRGEYDYLKDEELGDPRPPENLPYYPAEGDMWYSELMNPLDTDDDGITTDDFDNWPTGREFPS